LAIPFPLAIPLFVKQNLSDVAVISHNPGNGQFSSYGLSNLDAWLGDKEWDVIQFNLIGACGIFVIMI
jgi:hypothetical protein